MAGMTGASLRFPRTQSGRPEHPLFLSGIHRDDTAYGKTGHETVRRRDPQNSKADPTIPNTKPPIQ